MKPTRRKPLRKFRRFLELERLEDRTLLSFSINPNGLPPDWIEQGPAPILNEPNVQGSLLTAGAAGALAGIAIKPDDPNTAFVTAVNGGIWKTTDLNDTSPNWVPENVLGDLSMGAIAFAPQDPVINPDFTTLYAAAARLSSSGLGLFPEGLYKTVNGGQRWFHLTTPQENPEPFDGLSIQSVVSTQGNTVFVPSPAW